MRQQQHARPLVDQAAGRAILFNEGRNVSGSSDRSLAKIARVAVGITSQLSCLPPTLVGGSRATTLFLEPALAGLLEEFKSPAEAGCNLVPDSRTTN